MEQKKKKKKEIYCSIAGPSGRPQSSSMVNSSLIDDGYLLFYCIDISADSWIDRSSGMLTFTRICIGRSLPRLIHSTHNGGQTAEASRKQEIRPLLSAGKIPALLQTFHPALNIRSRKDCGDNTDCPVLGGKKAVPFATKSNSDIMANG
ncbi:hypothetical protein CDAR_578021 [Caerostris darwini]|uniref:Uncharacterized protein n=1 Tax=Caerostris darwini TaxID=1538125 RepID=A0AAV4TRB8_9ARAC|nr:hypothetical protein CDAR_578021 [Caerostris darwini]